MNWLAILLFLAIQASPKADAEDVPAMQIVNRIEWMVSNTSTTTISVQGELLPFSQMCDLTSGGKMDYTNGRPACVVTRMTCLDKSRILEHDENDPPKFWCRKVNP